jgi:MADS-box transcription factor
MPQPQMPQQQMPQQQMPPHQGAQHFQHPHAVASQQMGMPPGSHAPVQQVTQAYISEPGRGSMPPAYAPESQDRTVPASEGPENVQGGLKVEHNQSPPQGKSFSKSRSIFTPIDDRGSVLARHFGAGATTYESPRGNQALRVESQGNSPDQKPAPMSEPSRTQPMPSAADLRPTRSNSGIQGSKRPQLKVQIPSENSDRGSATGESGSRDSAGNNTATSAKDNPPTGVVLPPPSPSAGAILSAGAQGPPNPFARPPPPATAAQNNSSGNTSSNTNNGNTQNRHETPISALPSRFMSDALLPSPSSFFADDWAAFGRSGPDSNLLPSPLNFPTPAVQSGPSFSRDDEQDKKRKSPDSASGGEGSSKKPRTEGN